MKAADALIAWTPAGDGGPLAGQVKIGPLIRPGQADWAAPYAMTGGAAYTDVRDLKGVEAVARLFIDFHHMVVRDGVSPAAAHAAFLSIDEFAEALADDVPGAREPAEDQE